MKREIIQNTKAIPFSGEVTVDREGFLSGIVAVTAKASGDVKIAVTHGDTEGAATEAIGDDYLIVAGSDEVKGLSTDDVANFDLDLVGCKRYVKISVTGTAAADANCAVVLGDPAQAPV